MNGMWWLVAMFGYGLGCYIVGGWEERRDHDKWCPYKRQSEATP